VSRHAAAVMRYQILPYVAPFGLFINTLAFCAVDHWRRWVYLAIALLFTAYLFGVIREYRALMRQYR